MASLDRNLRRNLENAVKKARRVAEAGARQALDQLAVANHEPWSALTLDQRTLRNRLRAHGRQLGDRRDERKGTQAIERLAGECAYEQWHRLLFARFLAENDLLVEPDSGIALSLDECRELAREQNKDWLVLASEFAQRMLPQIFRAGDPVLELALPPEKRQELETILEGLPRDVFIADDSLGWVYQFWQAEQKDAINKSEHKIGADELAAVTQLFTEDYMVLFLLHNTLGAWWAGKVFAAKPDLALTASTEEECRAACAVFGIDWSYLRFVRDGGAWRPAAGTFPGWPPAANDLKVLDPCMGSGHFLAFALPILVALRRAEETLSVSESVDAVLRDNLFGLELDQRCTQIAAFNVGLTAWKLAGYRPLPALNLACAGLGINAPVAAWTALARGDAHAENAMKQLYELFRQAPTLGSLIDPTRVGGELFVAHFDKIRGLLSSALASEESENAELAIVAQGIARAASMLADQYTVVVTNVPYLGRSNQCEELRAYSETYHDDAKTDLATVMIDRCLRLLVHRGTFAVVTKQDWLYLDGYMEFRKRLLSEDQWNLVARLGPRAFEAIGGEVVNVALLEITNDRLDGSAFAGLDVTPFRTPLEKDVALRASAIRLYAQNRQLRNPDSRIVLGDRADAPMLAVRASSYQGIKTGDDERFRRVFWEMHGPSDRWRYFQSTVESTRFYGGLESLIDWSDNGSALARRQGVAAWGRRGLMVSQMSGLPVALYMGDIFDSNASPIVSRDEADLAALWAFCSSDEYRQAVRAIDQSLKPTNTSLVQVPFDLQRWSAKAASLLPDGIPPPNSNDPTQWIFSGQLRGAQHLLQVAAARLVGFRWPRQLGATFTGCEPLGDDGLESHADEDGIVCLPALRGETSAAERVRALLADAFGPDWSAQKLNELLADAHFVGKSLDDWLRDGFFEQHCALFRHRPFVWQIWDGRKDGFSALVNYHRLAAPSGEGRRILDKLTHTYLGEWLDRQRADQKAGVEGADGRVAAAEHLKRELEKILEGEPPYDLFVRWKPLHQQPVGWEPDLDDGVRVNIRPFMTAKPLNARGKNACILRVTPKVSWDKDRGKEPAREKADFPWFWNWDQETLDFMGGSTFDGNRWNDLHYSRAAKLAARERARGGKR
jgi:hypothetical protein